MGLSTTFALSSVPTFVETEYFCSIPSNFLLINGYFIITSSSKLHMYLYPELNHIFKKKGLPEKDSNDE